MSHASVKKTVAKVTAICLSVWCVYYLLSQFLLPPRPMSARRLAMLSVDFEVFGRVQGKNSNFANFIF